MEYADTRFFGHETEHGGGGGGVEDNYYYPNDIRHNGDSNWPLCWNCHRIERMACLSFCPSPSHVLMMMKWSTIPAPSDLSLVVRCCLSNAISTHKSSTSSSSSTTVELSAPPPPHDLWLFFSLLPAR